jgi:hypothetical protein
MDEEARRTLGHFETVDAAEAACRRIVDNFLLQNFEPGMSAAALLFAYRMFGEDPFIVAQAGPERIFSAWEYAERRANELCKVSQS